MYTPKRHGASHHTFLDKVGEYDPTLIAIKDSFGHVFGAFCTEEWRLGSRFYGTEEAFVYTFHKGEDMKLFTPTGGDDAL